MPDDRGDLDCPLRSGRRRRAGLVALALCGLTFLGACADAGPADAGGQPADAAASPAEEIAEQARSTPGIDDVRLTYADPDGTARDALPADPAGREGWVARIDLVHDLRNGASWASETVAALVAAFPETTAPRVEIWLRPTTLAEVSVLAHPVSGNAAEPVRHAYLLGATPGVAHAVSDGSTIDVQAYDVDDLAKVGDVIVAHGIPVDRIHTTDGAFALDMTSVPLRPEYTVAPQPWPDDPAAPDCSPDDLRLTIAGSDAATGHRVLVLAATNTGDVPCAVDGYPELAFRTLDGRELDVTVTHGRSFMAQDPGAARLVVPPGSRTLAALGWNAMPTAEYPEGSGNRPGVTAEVLVAAAPGTPPAELPLTSFALAPEEAHAADLTSWQPITHLDIVGGGEVAVTAWAPEQEDAGAGSPS